MVRTVNIAFNEFASVIEPKKNEIDKIINRHSTIRSEIGNNIKLDKNLPHFLSGSYKRSTLIHPANDVDVMLVLDREEYWEQFGENSRKLLEFMKRQLKKIYRNTTMRIQTHSIALLFTKGPKVDVVPGFLLDEEAKIFQIPDKEFEGYIRTSPHQHQELITSHNNKYPNFIRIVKMIKIWKRKITKSNNNHLKLKSFHIEMLALKAINKNTSNYRDGVILFFKRAEDLIKEKLIDPINLSGDISSYLSEQNKKDLSELMKEVNEKIVTLVDLENQGKHQDAISGWRGIFGHPFPKKIVYKEIKNQSRISTDFPEKGDKYTFG